MRGLVPYLLAAILVVLALDFLAPPVGLGLAVGASSAGEGAIVQSVDRSHKSDRLPAIAVEKQPAPPAKMLVGCDPAFSPLSASARANFARRCIA